jgi:hypothetical protein
MKQVGYHYQNIFHNICQNDTLSKGSDKGES